MATPVIKKIKRISKPGIRVYSKISDLEKPYGGLRNIYIFNTQRCYVRSASKKK